MIGIVCEFNPLHKGHEYLLQTAASRKPGSGIFCVMSGNYVQRGEPALYDKWTRTRMALMAGADLVAELPTYYAAATAEKFAFGAISLLFHSGLADSLCFGMEEPDHLPLLQRAADIIAGPDSGFEETLRSCLPDAPSFASARSRALELLLGEPLPAEPNEILALEYLISCRRLGWNPEIIPVKRTVPHQLSHQQDEAFLSASTLRQKLADGLDITGDLPCPLPCTPVFPDSMFPLIRYRLCFHNAQTLAGIDEVSEGLENRILKAASDCSGFQELVDQIRSKRYPTSRIRRILLNILLDISKEKKTRLQFESGPGYLRILGVSGQNLDLLSRLSQQSRLPVITQLKQMNSLPEAARLMLEDELRFSEVYRSLNTEIGLTAEDSIPMVILGRNYSLA